MVYVYEENNQIKYTRGEKPQVDKIIELEKMIPIPNKKGYISILNANFITNAVWYELEETKEHKLKTELEYLQAELTKYDYVKQQWDEETDLGLEHHRTEEEYLAILEDRQEKRIRIREIEEILGE